MIRNCFKRIMALIFVVSILIAGLITLETGENYKSTGEYQLASDIPCQYAY